MLVLHIGPHKTATTYLQANFKDQRAELLKRGWLYPTAGVRTATAHHDIAEARDQFVARRGPVFDTVAAVARKARGRNLDVLMSAEGFRRWNVKQVGALAELFECPSPRLVYVLRDPMTVLRSMWAQSIKVGGTEDLPRFLHRHMRDPTRSRLLNPMKDLQLHLRRDQSSLTILLYDELARRKRDIYSTFMSEALGIEGAEPSSTVANARPELELTEFLRLISTTGGYESLEGRVDVGDAVKHLFSPQERQSIIETIREHGSKALRTIEVRRDTPYYDEVEATLKEALGRHVRPPFEGERLFPTEPETWRCYNADGLMRSEPIRALVERAGARLKRRSVLVAVMNQGFRTILAGRRLRNRITARIN